MAVAYNEFRSLIGRIDNDNRPGFFAVKSSLPTTTAESAHRHAGTRVRQSGDASGARDRHALGVFPAPRAGLLHRRVYGRLPPFPGWLREAFGGCVREEMPFRYLVWASRSPAPGTWVATCVSFTRLIRGAGRGALRAYAYAASTSSTTIYRRPRPADPDRGADPGRRDRRRLRGDAQPTTS